MQFSKRSLLGIATVLSLCVAPVVGWDKEVFAYKEQCVQQAPAVNSTTIPRSFGMLLFPGWEVIDVWGPVQVIKYLGANYRVSLSLIAETLDPVSPAPMGPGMNKLNSSVYPSILPTHSLATAPDLDVLLIPGGVGTRRADMDVLLNYIRTTYPKVKYLITVCTGSLLAGRTGLLDGKRATTNKGAYASVVAALPKVKWQPQARWVVDGNIWTSSGLSAGIDISLEFVECMYGDAVAAWITKSMEIDRHTDPRWDPFADPANIAAVGGVNKTNPLA